MSSEQTIANPSAHDTADVAIRAENLSKCYRIYPGNKARLRQIFFPKKKYYEEFWALRDINFEVSRGEALGIIGPNGAGKSTLLQILAGILQPTMGKVQVKGRVSALLELGAGFDPQFTGRENAYMNGAIMGLSRKEMGQKIDAIREFADIGDFFDRPVRMYSSGMYMRLAFAVATSVDPDILVIDEILAVGDINFQAKCLNRMAELRQSGCTTVFVGHNMHMIRYFCKEALVLDKGIPIEFAPVNKAIEAYYRKVLDPLSTRGEESAASRFADGEVVVHGDSWDARITDFEILDANGESKDFFLTGEKAVFRIHYETRRRIREPSFSIGLYDQRGELMCAHNTSFDDVRIEGIDGTGHVDMVVESLPFLNGLFRVSIAITDKQQIRRYDWQSKCYTLRVVSGETDASGLVRLSHHWSMHAPESSQ